MKRQIVYIFTLFLLTIACESDYDLEKSIHIPDPQFRIFPAYPEWGHNTFGTLFDRRSLFSDEYEVPLKIINTNDYITMIIGNEISHLTPIGGRVHFKRVQHLLVYGEESK